MAKHEADSYRTYTEKQAHALASKDGSRVPSGGQSKSTDGNTGKVDPGKGESERAGSH